MQVMKKISPGVVVRKFTPAEMYACVDYALCLKDDFDVTIIGCSQKVIDHYAFAGYNALIDEGVFRLQDEDSYPMLTATEPDVVNFVAALEGTTSVMVMRIRVGRKSFPVYYVHNDVSWAFFWKGNNAPESWFVVAGSCVNSVGLTWLGITKNARSNCGKQRVTFTMQWFSITGTMKYETSLISDVGRYESAFYEPEPHDTNRVLINPNAADANDAWPHVYYGDALLMWRINYLLEEVN